MIERGSDRVMLIVEAITKRTAAEHYRLVLNEERKPVITGSKIGQPLNITGLCSTRSASL